MRELFTITTVSTSDKGIAVKPILEKIVEEEPSRIRRSVGRFFRRVAKSSTDRKEVQWRLGRGFSNER